MGTRDGSTRVIPCKAAFRSPSEINEQTAEVGTFEDRYGTWPDSHGLGPNDITRADGRSRNVSNDGPK